MGASIITDQDFAHWVYRMFDAQGSLLYVGMTVNPRKRLKAWQSVGRAEGHWWPEVDGVVWEIHESKAAAAAAEREAIRSEQPRHNIYMQTAGRGLMDTARAERMVSAYVNDDMTLEQIGRRYGVTRERVRQITSGLDRTMCLLVIRRRAARGRLRHLVNAGTPQIRTECPVCGSQFEGASNRRYCSPVHQKVAVMLRYQTDDSFRERQQIATARWVVKTKPDDDPRVRDAQRVINGTRTERGRWMTPGSLQFHWALRACALGWPIFDAFHEDVQRQIREHLAADEDVA